MSLVAYDSSDEGSENEENKPAVTINAHNDITESVTRVPTSSKLSLPAPKIFSQSTTNDEGEDSDDAEYSKLSFDTLPKPADLNSAINIIEEIDDISLKETENQVAKPTKRQTVKITVPSLSEFKDLEEESEKKPVRIVQSSEKGCGLFALLVPPAMVKITSNEALIPQAVKNAATRANIQQPRLAKKSDPSQTSVPKSTVDKSCSELNSDDEEDDAAVDFFGLTASKKTIDIASDRELPSGDFTDKSNTVETSLANYVEETDGQFNKTLTSNVMDLPKEEILLKNKAEVGPKLPVPEQEYNIDGEGNVAFDEKAIEYLCGKRGIKRKDKELDEANIIEINGEDIKPDEREWLVKALTEESVQRPVSMQSYGVNSQSKRKHQITYLAHQAKAMELELKNQWSQNRMIRKQTKSKYGF